MKELTLILCAVFVLGIHGPAKAQRVILENADGQVVNTPIDIAQVRYDGDWYLPNENAKGFVYLQHGFFRNSGNLRNLGLELMAEGLMVLSMNANMASGNAGLAREAADALSRGELLPPGNTPFPSRFALAGHSAGGLHVSIMAARLLENGNSGFSGLVLLDPVDANNAMAAALQTTANAQKPVLAILANASNCNSRNNAQPILSGLTNSEFTGFKLTARSSHVDAEGGNADFFSRLFCGGPRANNITSLQEFATQWASDMVTGERNADYYLGGNKINALIQGNQASLIKAE